MEFKGRMVLTLCVTSALLSSCAQASATVRPSATPSRTPGIPWVVQDFHGAGIVVTLDHPTAWRSQLQPLSLHYTAIFGFLANFPLRQFCTHPTASSFECTGANIGKIPIDGVLVNFGTEGYGPIGPEQKVSYWLKGP